MTLRALVVHAARLLGSSVVDERTGRVLGRAMILSFRGKVHLIGLEAPVRPVFLPQSRLTYWKQEMGFMTHPSPDFPHEPRP